MDRIVAHQAARTPDAKAVTHGAESMTYRQLERRVGELAGALRARGVGPGDRVGLSVEPGIARSVALLGALRSGAAYVPLDPAYPKARLALMAGDADLSLIVASSGHGSEFDGLSSVVTVDALTGAGAAAFMAESVGMGASPAYLIYTSGSTGTPKGVVMPHRALSNLIHWQLGEPGFGVAMRTLQFTPLSFDVHFQEMFTTWGAGGELVSVDDQIRRDASRLLAIMNDAQIERVFLPFVALQHLAEIATIHGPMPATLREVVTAGEQLQINDIIVDFFERLPGCRLHNHYGPSETHVVTAHTLVGAPSSWPVLPPIGRPISNATIHILDSDLLPVGGGEPGELCVSGVCVADEYWGSPDRTAERFVALPGDVETRVYRTGDLARWNSDGNLEYLGRIDDQLKIRGHRIEPGEVEAAILKHPAVRSCAVTAVEGGAGDRQLAAYMILDSTSPDVAAVAERLRAEQLDQWQGVWDDTYAAGPAGDSIELDLRGWVDSYDGQPIAVEDMKTWVDGTVDQVLALHPRRVLEIGTGSGLMLFRIAPHCDAYHGTDFSRPAIELLRTRTAGLETCRDVRLEQAAADQLKAVAHGTYDLVLMNSVTQHFPSLTYLLQVLKGVHEIMPEGHVVIGDVTSASLREAFFVSVEAARARSDESLQALRGRVERRLGDEEELVIDPGFFVRLGEWIPDIASVEVRLKPGRYHNELSRFRYDVLIRFGPAAETPVDVVRLGWARGRTEPTMLDEIVREHSGMAVVIAGVPNARVADMVMAAEMLRSHDGASVADWRTAVARRAREDREPGREPDDFLLAASDLGLPVSVTWGEAPDTFDVVIRPRDRAGARLRGSPAPDPRPLENLASQPLNVALMRVVERELRRDLAQILPGPMVPDRFELLARFPRTPSGKLDRRALPAPGRRRPTLTHDWVAPRGDTEEALAKLWTDVLGVDRVGATDSFFELGGNSILGVRLSMLLRGRFEAGLPLVTLFEYPTVRLLARFLDRATGSAPPEIEEGIDARAAKQREIFARGRRRRRS